MAVRWSQTPTNGMKGSIDVPSEIATSLKRGRMMNIPPIPGWLYHYFSLPTDRYVSAREAAPLMGVSKVPAHHHLKRFFKSRLVERKRIHTDNGRTAWGYRRVLLRVVYDENMVNGVRNLSHNTKNQQG